MSNKNTAENVFLVTNSLQDVHGQQTLAQPGIIYGKGSDPSDPTLVISPELVATTWRELNISEQGISIGGVYIDPKNRIINYGTHYSKRQKFWRFLFNPEVRSVKGEVVRINTKVRGQNRTEEEMNRTLVHESEHMAQSDRHDKKIPAGHVAIGGLMTFGALLGSRLGKNKLTKSSGAAIGIGIGYELGYWLAPHEKQARQRAGQVRNRPAQVNSTAIRRVG